VSVTIGGVLSRLNVLGALTPTLPAPSTCVACTVYWPSGRLGNAAVNAPVVGLRVAATVAAGEPVAVEPE
jgi:hypothetical protein